MLSEIALRELLARDIRARKLTCHGGPQHEDAGSCPDCCHNDGLEKAARLAEKIPHRNSWILPDWVMLGAPAAQVNTAIAGGVMLMASKEMTAAEFIRENMGTESMRIPGARRLAVLPVTRTTLLAEIKTFTTVYAADYPSAFKELFSQWSPDRDRGRGYPALEGR